MMLPADAALAMRQDRQRMGWSTTELAERARAVAAANGDPIKLSQQLISQFEQGTAKRIPSWYRYAVQVLSETTDEAAPDSLDGIEADAKLIGELVAFTGHRPAQIARNAGVANTTINRHYRRTATTRLSTPTLDLLRAAYPHFPGFGGREDPDGGDYVLVNVLPSYAGMGGGGSGEGDRMQARLSRRLIENELRGTAEDFELIDVRGDSMQPDFEHGDQILIDRRDRNPLQPGSFALFDGDGYVIKLVERIPLRRGWYRVFSANPRYSPYEVDEAEIQILGRPVWFARRL